MKQQEEQQRLESLKQKMTPAQRNQMAELLAAELKRRNGSAEATPAAKATAPKPRVKLTTKSAVGSSKLAGSLDEDSMADFYSDVGSALQQKRQQQMPVKQRPAKFPTAARTPLVTLPAAESILLYSVVGFGVLKIISVGMGASLQPQQLAQTVPAIVQAAETSVATAPEFRPGQWSQAEKQILTSLDERRVQLEKRNESLDKREHDIQNQAEALAERLAELRSLTDKLGQLRKEKDARYEARMEQLANVYGSMAPNEAAPLIARLEDSVSLGLLQRMPGKRMGQILSLMDKERAVELTRSLTAKPALD